MKSLLIALIAAPALALAGTGEATLRAECATKHQVAANAGEHTFSYHQGKLRGEVQPGKALACTDGQYTAYVASLDPARVMALNPTAAGKPGVEEHNFSYKKGKLVAQ